MLQALFKIIIASILSFQSHSGNDYQIFYRFPGHEQQFPLELDLSITVKGAIEEISKERQILQQKGYQTQLSFRGEVLLDDESFADRGIGADSVIDIIFIQLTPVQQILKAFGKTNFRHIFQLQEDVQNCSDFETFVRCDINGNPISVNIDLRGEPFEGFVDLSLFPDTIQRLRIIKTRLTATVDFLQLPRDLKMIDIEKTQFTADFSCMQRDRWPENLEYINFGYNDLFYGRLDFSDLPRSLKYIHISRVKQLNDIVFHDLPPNLAGIFMSGNLLNNLDLSEEVPKSLSCINIASTQISGEIKLQGLCNCTSLQFMIYEQPGKQWKKIQSAKQYCGINGNFHIINHYRV